MQRNVTEDGEKLCWRDIKWLRYTQQPGIVEFKTSVDESEPFKKINFLHKGTSWPKGVKLPLSYKGPNPISKEKKQNSIELLPFVDESFHDFYKNLATKEDLRDTLPDLDSEEEE